MGSKIIISPYSRKMRNSKNNPKNYPYWTELIEKLKEEDCYITQIGIKGEEEIKRVDIFLKNSSLKELERILLEHDLFISVDNAIPHLANLLKKPGIVLFGKSDPDIFGHKQNINLLKDRKYLRQYQFAMWEDEEFSPEVFVEPTEVIKAINQIIR